MPNWATTVIKFTTTKERLCELHGLIYGKNGAIDFNCFTPEEKNNPDWYDWRCENWGTKWNADSWWDDKNTLVMRTAWAPPGPIISKIEEQFHDMMIDMNMYLEFEGLKYKIHYENGKSTFQKLDEDGRVVKETVEEVQSSPIVKEDIFNNGIPLVYNLSDNDSKEFIYVCSLEEMMDDKLTQPLFEHYYCNQCINVHYLGVYTIDNKPQQCLKIIISEDPLKVDDPYRWLSVSGCKIEDGMKPIINGLEGLICGSFVVYNGLIMLRNDPRIGKELSVEEAKKINEPYIIEEVKRRQKRTDERNHATPEEIALWDFYNGEGHFNSGESIGHPIKKPN